MKRKILRFILKYAELTAWWARKQLFDVSDVNVTRARSHREPRSRRSIKPKN